MDIIKMSKNLTNKESFQLTKEQAAHKVAELAGQTVHIDAYVEYNTTNEKGEVKRVLSFKCGDEVYGTISGTFIPSFTDIAEFCEAFDEDFTIEVKALTSKNGRQFLVASLK